MQELTYQDAFDAYNQGALDKAIRICQANLLDAPEYCILLSQCHWAKGNIAEALLLPHPTPETSPEVAARIRAQKGFVLAQTGRFAEAREELWKALRLAETYGQDALVASIQVNRGTLFFHLNDLAQMEQCAREALAIAERLGDKQTEGSACAGLAKSYKLREEWGEAIHWYERALQVIESVHSAFYVSWMQSELGCMYLIWREYDKAMQLFVEALKYAQNAGARACEHTDLANIGYVHLCRGEYAKALSLFQEALGIAREIQDDISAVKWMQNLARTYTLMGSPNLAASYQREADEVVRKVSGARALAAS